MKVEDKIKFLRKQRGWTQKQMSELMNTTPAQIGRLENGDRKITLNWLTRFAKVFGVPETDLISSKLCPLDICKVPVIGFVQAGIWQEANSWRPDEAYFVYSPYFPEYNNKHLYALEVRGDSMNLIYPEGSSIICLPLIESDKALTTGQRVICQRINPKDGSVEATVKEFVRNGEGVFLIPHSSNPEYKPIRIDNGAVGENQIIAIVVGSFRKE